MTPEVDPGRLSDAEKDALILALFARVAALEKRVEELTRPLRTPDNSSTPPARGHKPNRPSGDRPPRGGRPGVARALAENPDHLVEARLDACPACQASFPAELQTPQGVYDRIELPPVRPDVTRVHLFGGRCACCGVRSVAPAPAGLEPGSPFGRSVEAMAVYLHYAHAIGLERLRALMGEVLACPSARARCATSWPARVSRWV